MPPKFIQISVASTSEGTVCYALGDDGCVYLCLPTGFQKFEGPVHNPAVPK